MYPMSYSAATPLANQLAGLLGAWRGGLPAQMMTGGMPYRQNQYQGRSSPLFPGQPQGATGLNFRSATPPWLKRSIGPAMYGRDMASQLAMSPMM